MRLFYYFDINYEIENEFREISKAIKMFDPLVHEKDFIVLRKFGEE